ncbi:unnamed protein product [Pedinophyceae sp. YPF-701]|nr:unnamed protein product [Pedinophyceae sp. YPF-701]
MARIGMMDNAYFVGRGELLGWINSTLNLSLSKIEETCSGAVACQMVDAVKPGAVRMDKVNFTAKSEYEYINNYKELQKAFDKLGLDKHIEVNKLIKGRPLDNTEFMQWLKAWFDAEAQSETLENYNPDARRAKNPANARLGKASSVRAAKNPPARTPSNTGPAAVRKANSVRADRPSGAPAAANTPPRATKATTPAKKAPAAAAGPETEELTRQLGELKMTVEQAEKERDFYFGKLREIEILCQYLESKDMPLVNVIEKILYATDDEGTRVAMEEAQKTFGFSLDVPPGNGDAAAAPGQEGAPAAPGDAASDPFQPGERTSVISLSEDTNGPLVDIPQGTISEPLKCTSPVIKDAGDA